MQDNSGADQTTADTQIAALLASAAVVVGFVVYWSLEIQATLDMLELAYG